MKKKNYKKAQPDEGPDGGEGSLGLKLRLSNWEKVGASFRFYV